LPVGFMLINVQIVGVEKTVKQISKIRGVKKYWRLYGIYDVITKIDRPDLESLKYTSQQIRKHKKVEKTLLMIVV